MYQPHLTYLSSCWSSNCLCFYHKPFITLLQFFWRIVIAYTTSYIIFSFGVANVPFNDVILLNCSVSYALWVFLRGLPFSFLSSVEFKLLSKVWTYSRRYHLRTLAFFLLIYSLYNRVLKLISSRVYFPQRTIILNLWLWKNSNNFSLK